MELSTVSLVCTIAQGVAAIDYLANRYVKKIEWRRIYLQWPTWVLPTLVLLSTAFNTWLYLESRSFGGTIRFHFPPKNTIVDANFVNQEVSLDDFTYRDCTFQNVTLVYNGIAPFGLSHNHFIGAPQILTSNDAVAGTVALLKGIGALPDNVQLFGPNRRPVTTIQPPMHKE